MRQKSGRHHGGQRVAKGTRVVARVLYRSQHGTYASADNKKQKATTTTPKGGALLGGGRAQMPKASQQAGQS